MTRDELLKILGEGATDEQINGVLDKFHEKDNEIRDAKAKQNDLAKAQSENAKLMADLAKANSQLDEINKANMTEQQRIDALKQEAEKNYSESRKVFAKAKATEILSSVGITDENLINTLVSDNVELTEKNANIYVESIKSIKESVEKQTKEAFANADLTPTTPNNNNSSTMTWEKYTSLSEEEQSKFAQEHPQEFANL